MNPEDLVKELVHQNKLLKETIPFLLMGTNNDDYVAMIKEHSETSEDYTNSETSSINEVTLSDSLHSNQQTIIEIMLDLLDRQEHRLDLLEKFGKTALLESSNLNDIPIFRGLGKKEKSTMIINSSSVEEEEIQVSEWTIKIIEHINKIKSVNSTQKESLSKEIIKFIFQKLDLEPLEFLKSLLKKNQILVLKKFKHEIPIQFYSDSSIRDEHGILFLFPFKLHLLRHPKALLNYLNSKF